MGTWGRTLTSLSCCHPGCEHHQRDLPPPYHYRRTANACEDGWRWKSTLPQARLVTRRWLVCATSQLEVEHHDLRGRHCGGALIAWNVSANREHRYKMPERTGFFPSRNWSKQILEHDKAQK